MSHMLNGPWPFPTSAIPVFKENSQHVEYSVSWPYPVDGLKNLVKEKDAMVSDALKEIKYAYVAGPKGYKFSFAYRLAVKGNRAEFIDLAVATCSPNDQYIKRVGRDLATSRLLNGEYVTLPLGIHGAENVAAVLHGIFGVGAL